MTWFFARFMGDPAGYRFESSLDDPLELNKTWRRAKYGTTDEDVVIDLSKAYVIERIPATN